MSASTWRLSIAVLIVLTGAWFTGSRLSARTPLRSAHSEPTRGVPDQPVIVTEAGKVFHRDGCPLVHGPAVPEPGARAIAAGYTPCTRCLPQY
jgi:hypothetical protein